MAWRIERVGLERLAYYVRPWQFLYFFPLPHGQGALRCTFSSRLRIGSIFVAACEPSIAACVCSLMPGALGGASSLIAADSTHVLPTKFSSSCSILQIRSVT